MGRKMREVKCWKIAFHVSLFGCVCVCVCVVRTLADARSLSISSFLFSFKFFWNQESSIFKRSHLFNAVTLRVDLLIAVALTEANILNYLLLRALSSLSSSENLYNPIIIHLLLYLNHLLIIILFLLGLLPLLTTLLLFDIVSFIITRL